MVELKLRRIEVLRHNIWVLDWPENVKRGEVFRVYETTWGEVLTNSGRPEHVALSDGRQLPNDIGGVDIGE